MDLTDFQTAIDYVQRHGTPVERARLAHVVNDEQAPQEIRELFERSQRGDGGWAPFWSPEYSSLDATCYQLAQMEQLGFGRRSLPVVDAARFLAERQRLDGSWQEEEAETDAAPVWAKPGDLAATLYVTANCAFWLSLTGLVPPAVRDAAAFLAGHMGEGGALPSFAQTHWLAAVVWRHEEMATEADKALAHLRELIPSLSAGNVAWLLLALGQGGFPSEDETMRAAAGRLRALRDPAGHWPSDEAADNAVHVTIEAIHGLTLFDGTR